MNRSVYIISSAILALGLAGCSGEKQETKQAPVKLDTIQGKAQINLSETSSADAALNAGGQSAYLWQGMRRYRLYLKTPFTIEGGKYYAVEGIDAQKMIDSMGDPDNGKNGYPLEASCDRVVKTAWPGEAFDVTDGQASALRMRIKRFPARPVFLVTKITQIDSDTKKDDAQKKADQTPEIQMPADKAKALLTSNPAAQTAPLWEPAGGTVKCKIVIGADGKVTELETGKQLCEAVDWDQYVYKPTLQGGKPVQVGTEVEATFNPRK